jgi:opacity protein-like surface antigen
MINKELLTACSFTVFLLSSSVFAKTQGNYIGFDILNTSAVFQYKFISGKTPNEKVSDSNFGVGLNYKYAFNINNFFFAPGIFVELNDTYVRRAPPTSFFNEQEEYRMKSRFGVKFDAGYDLTNNFAIYLTGGASRNDYEVNFISDFPGDSNTQIGYTITPFYGAGFKAILSKNINIGLEYNAQSMDTKGLDSNFTTNIGSKVAIDLQIIKLGISYNF